MPDVTALPLSQVYAGVDDRARTGRPLAPPVATGFRSLDVELGGGLRPGELTLLGGPPGLGKTTLAVQLSRNVARAGGTVVYVSFEHDEVAVLTRLLALEAAEDEEALRPLTLTQVRQVLDGADAGAGLDARLAEFEGGATAAVAVRAYAASLHVLPARASTGVQTLRDLVTGSAAPALLVVDYLQKLAPSGAERRGGEDERLTEVVQDLKDLTLTHHVPVLAVVAMEKTSATAGGRLRINDVRGPSALGYEADVVLLLQEKRDVVARHLLTYGAGVHRYDDWVVLSIEKNRGGAGHVDLEVEKRLANARFGHDMRLVTEQLVDDRVFVE